MNPWWLIFGAGAVALAVMGLAYAIERSELFLDVEGE
jgi:hypothetical protein